VPNLPSGTVTLVFTDVEGSTRLLREHGPRRYAQILAAHSRVLREACGAGGGVEVNSWGDAYFFAFRNAQAAVTAAAKATEALLPGPVHIRIGIHTGTPRLAAKDYIGVDVNLAARLCSSGHGGQVLLSRQTRALVQAEVTDLGEHRLKDVREPVWIFQLGADPFPPLKTISNTNLPRPASSFVGRERERREVTTLIREGARLVTLTGPGGSGKTRLALEVAAELVAEFKNGVFWVALEALLNSSLVGETVGRTLGAANGLAEYIGQREMLLLLDNFEQVIEAAPTLAGLVEQCPNLCLLVTSRERLRVRGEREYVVTPLRHQEATALFCSRANVDLDQTISELCDQLDNLPLAVELAAARVGILSPSQILGRMPQRLDLLQGGRDAAARQKTLRAAIDWSYQLLSEQEKQLLARLTIFRGGNSLEAAERIAAASLDGLQSLTDKHLLGHIAERFFMLETIREFAAEQLAVADRDAVSRRHAEYFLGLAEEGEPHLRHQSTRWLDQFELELDNLRAALDWYESSGETQCALRMTAVLFWLWSLRGRQAEGRRRLAQVLARDERSTLARARALYCAADLAIDDGDLESAKRCAQEAIALYEELGGDPWDAAYCVYVLAHASVLEQDWKLALQRFEESFRRFEKVGDDHYMLEATRKRAWMYEALGDRGKSRALHEANLDRARAAGNDYMVATTLAILSTDALAEGRYDDAIAMLQESSRIHLEIGDRWGTVLDVRRLARLLAEKGMAETALRVLSSAQAAQERMGIAIEQWIAGMEATTMAAIRARLEEPAVARIKSEGLKLPITAALGLALETAAGAARIGGKQQDKKDER
jgi:predicted ATPase